MDRFMASVTFEYDREAPQTVKGEIFAGSLNTAASRAVKLARATYRNAQPRSLVVVLEKVAPEGS